jgi:hypothetical protein
MSQCPTIQRPLVATRVEAAELAIALGELRKGKDRRVTQLIAALSARYHSASSEQAAVPRGEAA